MLMLYIIPLYIDTYTYILMAYIIPLYIYSYYICIYIFTLCIYTYILMAYIIPRTIGINYNGRILLRRES